MTARKRLLVIGLDGATFDIIKPNLHRLPTLRKLIEGGTHGTLRSTIPPVTIPAWPAMFTGKNPGKIGAFDFRYMEKDYAIKPHNLSTMNCTYVWDIMDRKGMKSAVINVPGTWPIRPLSGPMVSCMLTPPGRDFAHPKTLQKRIEKEIPGYSTALMEGGGKIESSYRTFEANAKILGWFLPDLGRKLDAIFMVFRVPDVLSHARDAGEKDLVECYMRIDQELGRILSGSNTDIMVVSDHGYGLAKGSMLFINTWLERNGYLSFRKDHKPAASKNILALRRIFMGRRRSKIARILLSKTGRNVPFFSSPFDASMVDMQKTMAFSYNTTTSPYCGIWLNVKGRYENGVVDKGDYQKLRNEIAGKLRSDGMIKAVYMREELYKGGGIEIPDMVAEANGLLSSGISPALASAYKGCHAINGIFIAYGPGFRSGSEIKDARVWDIAPTVLHMLGLPVPEDMDGRVLKDIFTPGSHPQKNKPRFTKPEVMARQKVEKESGDEERMKQRLKELGYI